MQIIIKNTDNKKAIGLKVAALSKQLNDKNPKFSKVSNVFTKVYKDLSIMNPELSKKFAQNYAKLVSSINS